MNSLNIVEYNYEKLKGIVFYNYLFSNFKYKLYVYFFDHSYTFFYDSYAFLHR